MKSLSRRDFLKLGGAALLAASLPALEPAQADMVQRVPLVWRGSTRHRYLALTYDDCYLLKCMHELEKLLDEYRGIRITLFPVGVALLNLERQDAGIWRRFYENGHEIGYHSWDHINFAVMSASSALADYARWLDALTAVLGFQPTVRFGRPTFGLWATSFNEVCRQYGLVNTMWSTGWGGNTEDIVRSTVPKSRNGDIVLLHVRPQDCNTSREAYPWMIENGWRAVTMSRLYDDVLLEQINSEGCDVDEGSSLTRTCME